MIKNEREYKITRASLAKFQQAVEHITKLQAKGDTDQSMLNLQAEAAKSMMNQLREQLEEYEQLRAGKFDLATLQTIEALPNSLICARIAVGWTQKDLAKHLGTSEQQIQKYESTDYESASFRKIAEIAAVLKAASEARQSGTK